MSIEASPYTFEGLKRNVSLNRLDNVRLINAAAWNKSEKLDLMLAEWNTGTSTVVSEFADVEAGGYETKDVRSVVSVDAKPMFALLQPEEIANAALLKIDAEGAEPEILEGMLPLLPRFPDDVRFIIELSPEVLKRRNRRLDDIMKLMVQHGFRPYTVVNQYTPEFYLNTLQSGAPKVVPLRDRIVEHMDVIFSREAFV